MRFPEYSPGYSHNIDAIGFDMTRDGRWVAVNTMQNDLPALYLIRVDQDGSSTITQRILFNFYPNYPDPRPEMEKPGRAKLAFTPDGRGLLMSCQAGPYHLRWYELDREQGKVIFKVGIPTVDQPGGVWLVEAPTYLAVTPDGRFAVLSTTPFLDTSTNTSRTALYPVRLFQEDWSLQLLDSKAIWVDQGVTNLTIAPLPDSQAGPEWVKYK